MPVEDDVYLAIDPGNVDSAYAECRFSDEYPAGFAPLRFDKIENSALRQLMLDGEFGTGPQRRLVIETPKPRGVPTSSEEMETLIVIGRFIQAWSFTGGSWSYVFRDPIKVFICGRTKNISDANVRRAVLDLFGGETTALGGQRCKNCAGTGFKGRQAVLCDQCEGRKLVPAKKGGQRKCPGCGARGYKKGDPAMCPVCEGSGVLQEVGPLHSATADVYAALAIAAYWANDSKIVQRLSANMSKRGRSKSNIPDVRKVQNQPRTSVTVTAASQKE